MTNWGAPQHIVAAVIVLTLIRAFILDGKPRSNYEFGSMFMNALLWSCLLAWGGFFR